MEKYAKRKTPRLQSFDYNSAGAYFITICTQNRRCILSHIARANSVFSKFMSTFKRFCNKEYGENIWQARTYDHIIRNMQDYEEHLQYIQKNPLRWHYDEFCPQE